MKTYTHLDAPLRVCGVPHFEKSREFRRLPDALINQEILADIKHHRLGLRTPGARVAFRTDADEIRLRMTTSCSFDLGMSVFAARTAYVYLGDRANMRYAGMLCPGTYEKASSELIIRKAAVMEEITVYLPRNEHVEAFEVELPDGATVTEPTPYSFADGKPIVFYGSSITEGGCSTIAPNAYTAMVARHLDADHINLGFSGHARGESCMADYINTLDMSVFVLDYDHNAPTVEHLAATHELFFLRVRKAHPTLPIIMMTRPNAPHSLRPDGELNADVAARREVVLTTYWERLMEEELHGRAGS